MAITLFFTQFCRSPVRNEYLLNVVVRKFLNMSVLLPKNTPRGGIPFWAASCILMQHSPQFRVAGQTNLCRREEIGLLRIPNLNQPSGGTLCVAYPHSSHSAYSPAQCWPPPNPPKNRVSSSTSLATTDSTPTTPLAAIRPPTF